jgi:DNA polymerase-4
MRTIFHVDMDAFFVSVEELYDPSLKGKSVVVGGRPNERGVVAAASYTARQYGVHSAMPLSRASRLCPQAIFVEGHPERYREYSDRVFHVFERYSPLVEMASIDEAYLDLTGCDRLLGPALAAAHRLHEEVRRETSLPCSIGIGTTRLIAKIASDQAKPNGILWVVPGAEADFLAPLDVRKIPGVGPVTEKNLRQHGIRKVADLAERDEDFLEAEFGLWGLALAGKARGEDAGGWFDTPVAAGEDAKSLSHETTYGQDTADPAMLESTLAQLSQMVGRRLRESGLHGRTVQLKLRYSDFSTITRARTLPETTQLDNVIFEAARDLFRANWKRGCKVRLLGVQVASLSRREGQLDLLEGGHKDKWRRALAAADRLRDRYGERTVGLAGGLAGGWRERVHENPAGLPGKKRTSS